MSRGARPHAPIGRVADDFNRLLEKSRRSYPSSALVPRLRPPPATAPLVALLTRVSLLRGALHAAAGNDVNGGPRARGSRRAPSVSTTRS